jgi:hypothetical protein
MHPPAPKRGRPRFCPPHPSTQNIANATRSTQTSTPEHRKKLLHTPHPSTPERYHLQLILPKKPPQITQTSQSPHKRVPECPIPTQAHPVVALLPPQSTLCPTLVWTRPTSVPLPRIYRITSALQKPRTLPQAAQAACQQPQKNMPQRGKRPASSHKNVPHRGTNGLHAATPRDAEGGPKTVRHCGPTNPKKEWGCP